jgi:hypothetical protein
MSLSFLKLTNWDTIFREPEMGPSMGMTPIFSLKENSVEGLKRVRTSTKDPPKKTAITPRMTKTVNMGCFLSAIVLKKWDLREGALEDGRTWEIVYPWIP